VDNGSTRTLYGSTVVGGTNDVVFTVRNAGESAVTLDAPSVFGAQADDFGVSALPSSLAPGASDTFTLSFSPSAIGPRQAALRFETSVEGESPFTVNLSAIGRAVGADISYPDFTAAEQLTVNGDAAVADGRLVLTPDESSRKGSAWHETQVDVSGFSTTFRFQVTADGSASDGLTFALQPNGTDELGNHGGSLGYKGMSSPRLGVFFEFHNASSIGLFSGNETVASVEPLFEFEDGSQYEATITYDGADIDVSVLRLEDGTRASCACAIDIPDLPANNTAYAGFTGGTGAGHARQEVLSWVYTSGEVAAVGPHVRSRRVAVHSSSRQARWYSLTGRALEVEPWRAGGTATNRATPPVGFGVYVMKDGKGKLLKRSLPAETDR
jgi:hypothetical protein